MNSSLNPGKIAERLEEKTDLKKDVIKELAGEIFAIAARELRTEDAFSIFGFGNFKRIFVPASTARNPQTGEEIDVPEHYRVKFTPAGKTAERINAEFSHLKPRILEDDEIPEGLLAKAERYVISDNSEKEPEWFEDSGHRNEKILEETPTDLPSNNLDSSDTEISNALWDEENTGGIFVSSELTVPGFEEVRSKGRRVVLAVLILLILLGIGGWFIFGETKTKNPPEAVLVEEKKEVKESVAEISKTELEEPLSVAPYQIRSGESFSALTIKKWGALALWPYLYMENMEPYPDPDVVKTGDNIRLPDRPDSAIFQKDIQSSILFTYKRYKDLINLEPKSPRNPERRLNAGYVLMGGEVLYPGFMDKYSDRIDSEDRKFASSLIR